MMKGEERILEIHEGCLPDERDEGIVGTSDQTQNTERTSRASDVSGTRSASKRSLGEENSTDEGKNKKLRTDATTPMKKSNLDEKLEEDVLRKQQAIIANAMRRRAVSQPPTATSLTRSEVKISKNIYMLNINLASPTTIPSQHRHRTVWNSA